jgi:hypothetical protein
MMKKILISIAILVLVVTAYLLTAVAGSKVVNYECYGENFLGNSYERHVEFYVSLTEYSPLVFWGKSNASATIEFPNALHLYRPHLKRIGNSYSSIDAGLFNFSTLSRTIRFSYGENHIIGVCEKIRN